MLSVEQGFTVVENNACHLIILLRSYLIYLA